MSSYRELQASDCDVVQLDGVESMAKAITVNSAPLLPQISTLMPMPFMTMGDVTPQPLVVIPPAPEQEAEFVKKTRKIVVEIFCCAHNPVSLILQYWFLLTISTGGKGS